ncbi:MAG TPA: alpha/beta hydrolase, partial [Nocardioides sp.]|nr:alpha/beta hydrolase [Nocardioides sp.]
MPRLSGVPALAAAGLTLALGLGLVPGLLPGGATALAGADDPVPVVTWWACPAPEVPGVPEGPEDPEDTECGTVEVPLDYDDPTGPTLTLDLVRVPASDPDLRIGTLFVNPGGPGAPATSFAAQFGHLVPRVLSQRFDVVGIDPRGVGPSALATCRDPDPRPRAPRAAFPTSQREVRAWIAADRWWRQACRHDPEPVVDHLSTADTARDMDLVRRALGEDLLTYYGISYGTQLGSTYAAMFPGTIRAMILDGVLDPVSWSTGRPGQGHLPFSTRVGSHRGSWQALRAALADCDAAGPRRCAIAGDALGVWRDVARRLERAPFQGVRYSDLIGMAAGSLYDPRSIRWLMRRVGALHEAMHGGDERVRPRVWRRAAPSRGPLPGPVPGPYAGYGRTTNPFAAIACADSDNPSDPRRWVGAGRRADGQAPGFGSLWTWMSSACAGWPQRAKEDRFTGPYAVTPSAP